METRTRKNHKKLLRAASKFQKKQDNRQNFQTLITEMQKKGEKNKTLSNWKRYIVEVGVTVMLNSKLQN